MTTEFLWNYYNYFDQNSCQELDDHRILVKFFDQNFACQPIVSNNSDDYEIIQELDDDRILVKFFGIWSEFFKK